MLTSRSGTARKSIIVIVLAVLFSPIAFAEPSELMNLEAGLNDLVYRISPSIVTVQADFSSPVSATSSAMGNEFVRSMISSGIIVDSVGHIMVAAASVAGSYSISIHLPSKQAVRAELVGIDYISSLALLRTATSVGMPAPILPQYLCGGQMILAVGNSHGLRVSPSLGFCAGVRDDGRIQFNSLITAGTMGGGLFDLSGMLVGVISGGLGSDNRIETGLAVPAGKIQEIIDFLLEFGDRPSGYIGVTTREIEINPGISTRPTTNYQTVSNTNPITHGLLVTAVDHHSPAATAGLRPGDLVYSIDGKGIFSASVLKQDIVRSHPGRMLRFEFLRENRSYTIQVSVAGRRRLSDSQFQLRNTALPSSRDSIVAELGRLKESIRVLEARVNTGF